MARTYRGGYPRSRWIYVDPWKRVADGGSDTRVKSWHTRPTVAAERAAVRNLLALGLEPEPTKWMSWWHLPPAPRPIAY